MSNIDVTRYLITSISGQDSYLTVNKMFVKFMGSLEGGVFLQQLIFWSDKSKSDDGFFYKSYVEWENEISLSEYSVRKQTKVLKEKGVLQTKLKKVNSGPTLHYKFDMNGFLQILETFLKDLSNESEKFKERSLKNQETSYTEEYYRRTQQKTNQHTDLPLDTDFAEVLRIYEQNFGLVSGGFDQEDLGDMVDNYKKDLIIEAIKEARSNQNVKKPLRLISKILKNWAAENIHTAIDLQNYLQQKEREQHGQNNRRSTSRTKKQTKYPGLANYNSQMR